MQLALVLNKMWAVYVVFFVAFILTLDYFLLDKRQHELAMKLNFPPRLPLIGHAWMVINVQAKGTFANSVEFFLVNLISIVTRHVQICLKNG